MISMWALLSEDDVRAYAATVILPPYLSHLRLGPFRFAAQGENRDGREPLRLTYLGPGRLEEFVLDPREHALAMIQFICPKIDAARIQLPRDDASWHWTASADPPEDMRIYFAPATRRLSGSATLSPCEDAYVSVSRGHVFVGRSAVKSYLEAWLSRLGIGDAVTQFEFGTPSGGIEFRAGAIGGEMFLCDEVLAEDLLRFAGLDRALNYVGNLVALDLGSVAQDRSGVYADGIYINLLGRVEESDHPRRGDRPPDRPQRAGRSAEDQPGRPDRGQGAQS
jgi:hypothetical protein